MKFKVVLGSLLVLLLLSAFVPQPAPLFAVALPEGRTLDEGHDSGYIDWSGGVNYADLFHRDGICGSGCTENVTQISNGATVSGNLAGDVSYFEVMLAYSSGGGFGTATIQACSSSYSVYMGIGGATPGFNSFALSVPSGCTSWSVSASGGVVYFRSVDANYSYIPPTNTFTPSPAPTETETPTPTPTETLTPTATATETPTPTSTSTETLTPTPSDTPTPSNTPVPSSNNGDDSDSSSDSGWHFPVIPFVLFPSATPNPTTTPLLSVQVVPTIISKTSTPKPYSVVSLPSSVPACGAPPSSTANASGNSSEFPWWLFPAGLSVASALSFLNSFLKQSGGKVASLTPSGVAVPVPKTVWRTTTVGEWVTRPVRTMVQITRTIWKTITEAVPRFVQRVRQFFEYVARSEWVKSVVQVAQTVYKWVAEKAPLLNWLGWIIGFIWKNVLKPFIAWVAKTIYTLKTWVEKIVRQVVEWVQDGWNYITRQVSETVREWVEKTEWVRNWVTREITVPEIVWETKFIPLPSLSLSSILTTDLIRTLAKLLPTLGLAAISITMCATPSLPTTPTATPDIQATAACLALTLQAEIATQTALALPPTPVPTGTATLDPLNTERELHLLLDWLTTHRNDPAVQQWLIAHGLLNPADIGNDSKLLEAVNQAVIPWQNQYNADIQRIAIENNIPPEYLKALFLQENQFGWTPVLNNPNANGPGQLFGWGLDMAFNNGTAPNAYIKAAYERSGQVFYDSSGNVLTPEQFGGDYQAFYQALPYDSQTALRGFAIPFVNLTCDNYETCPTYGGLKPDEAVANLEVSTQALVGARNIAQDAIEDPFWSQMSTTEQLKFAIAIYNSGGGTCVGDAIDKTKASGGNPGSWDQVKANLGSNCTAAGAYVDGVTSYLP